jgi:hypothetical protein
MQGLNYGLTCGPLVEHAGLDNLLVHVQFVPGKKKKIYFKDKKKN